MQQVKKISAVTTGELQHAVEREFQERYRALLDFSPNAVCIHLNGTLVYANPAALKLAGFQHIHQVVGLSVFDFLHTDSHDLIQQRMQEMKETRNTPPIIELECTWPDGSRSEVELISTVVPWHGESAVQFILRDITEHKQWERKLQEQEKIFHQLADSMPQIVWTANEDGFIDYRNRQFFERTALSDAILANHPCPWALILHPDDAPVATEKWNECVKNGQPFEMEYRYKTTGPEFRWHLGRALPMRDEHGKVVRWFGTCTDIHEQKMAELRLKTAETALADTKRKLESQVRTRTAKLNASIKSMEDFCYSIAHNLRAPVRAMQGFSTALYEDYKDLLDTTGKDYLTRIHNAAGNMDTLILDLLAYGRIDHQELTLRTIHLHDAIDLTFRHLPAEINESKAQFHFDRLNHLILADENMLRHIFGNLFTNAVKFGRPNVAPEIFVSAEDRGDKIRVTVEDNGIGILPDHQQRIFHAFERLNTADQFPGTGIGLAIARKAAARLNGLVGVESELNKGSCFWVELPKTTGEKA